ncbi:TAXI family TRAP transporter solute-binding subunit [Leptolyngbya sp. FACHB-36]|nr:TAXI family TRAP transporter solute-binding subunit [Leptolyngbya sp. FACHB-36]
MANPHLLASIRAVTHFAALQFRSTIRQMAAGLLLLVTLGSCSRSESISISSGLNQGYYNRLGEQIRSSANAQVKMSVQNRESQGSRQNLQRLLDREVDFALVQLDVASEAMRQGKVQAIAMLASEPIHLIIRANAGIRTFQDLRNKRVAIGSEGSGTRYTANQLLTAARLTIREDDSNFDQALKELRARQTDALIYVGSLGASETLRQQFDQNLNLRLISIPTSVVNYLTVRDPGSYQAAQIPIGTYSARPSVPAQDLSTFSTATVVVTRPDMSREKVGLLTWSILSTSRKYAQFYPALQTGEPRSLMQQGLVYIHPAAQDVYEEGDPRDAWMRYWENNSDLQAGLFILISTSGVGLLLRHWRKEQSKKLASTTTKRINELRTLLPQETAQALQSIEALQQEHRVMFVEGTVPTEVYEQVQRKTQMFADECRSILEQQRKHLVLDTLLLLDEWQASLQTDPAEAMQKLTQIKQQYRDMLLSDQVDISAYIELVELTLLSLMTLAPASGQPRSQLAAASLASQSPVDASLAADHSPLTSFPGST